MAIPKDLDDGIFGACVAMHHRDIAAAHDAVRKYLGEDTVAEAAAQEFSALSTEQQKYYRATGLGRFGAYSLMTTFEVQAALKVVAREIDRSHCFSADFERSLRHAGQAARITERFPAITAERIEAVLR